MGTLLVVTDATGREIYRCPHRTEGLALEALTALMTRHERCSASLSPCPEPPRGETLEEAAARWEREGRAFD